MSGVCLLVVGAGEGGFDLHSDRCISVRQLWFV